MGGDLTFAPRQSRLLQVALSSARFHGSASQISDVVVSAASGPLHHIGEAPSSNHGSTPRRCRLTKDSTRTNTRLAVRSGCHAACWAERSPCRLLPAALPPSARLPLPSKSLLPVGSLLICVPFGSRRILPDCARWAQGVPGGALFISNQHRAASSLRPVRRNPPCMRSTVTCPEILQ